MKAGEIKCSCCGLIPTRPYSNGTGDIYCEGCAVKSYKKSVENKTNLPFDLVEEMWSQLHRPASYAAYQEKEDD